MTSSVNLCSIWTKAQLHGSWSKRNITRACITWTANTSQPKKKTKLMIFISESMLPLSRETMFARILKTTKVSSDLTPRSEPYARRWSKMSRKLVTSNLL
jgi:hypothetical protein